MRTDQRRHPWIRVFEDSWRKLLSIALALVLWYYLDSQVTATSTDSLEVVVVFDGKQSSTQDQISISIGSLEYSLDQILDATGKPLVDNQVKLTLRGKKHLIERVKKERMFQVQNVLTDVLRSVDDQYFVEFGLKDLRHPSRPDFNDLLYEMQPATVKILLEKNQPRDLALTHENIDLQGLSEELRARISVEITRFDPPTLHLNVPQAKLDSIGPKAKIFSAVFTVKRSDRIATITLTLTKEFEWLKLEKVPTATFKIDPIMVNYVFEKVPVVLDVVGVSQEDAAKFKVSRPTMRVEIGATGSLETALLQVVKDTENNTVKDEWVNLHARVRVFLTKADISKDIINRDPNLQLFVVDPFSNKMIHYREGIDFRNETADMLINIERIKKN